MRPYAQGNDLSEILFWTNHRKEFKRKKSDKKRGFSRIRKSFKSSFRRAYKQSTTNELENNMAFYDLNITFRCPDCGEEIVEFRTLDIALLSPAPDDTGGYDAGSVPKAVADSFDGDIISCGDCDASDYIITTSRNYDGTYRMELTTP